tara:strand:- start:877 stop:1392 length:516 start_codon:yes stop_codon:yes gene_type:complete
MVRAKLKDHFLRKKIDKLSKTISKTNNGTSQKIKSIAIITVDSLSKQHDFSEILNQKLQRRNPKIYSYRKFSKNDQKSYKHFSEKDFNWRGDITDTSLQIFLEEPFDLLICFYSKKNIFLEYAVTSSKAAFKVGFSGIKSGIFDLEIASETNQISVFFNEMKKYLDILHKL